MAVIGVLCFLIALLSTVFAQGAKESAGAPDPDVLIDTPRSQMHYSSAGLTRRPVSINRDIRNLVLICAGQSNRANTTPTLYIPTNSTKIDALNIYDGTFWSIKGPLPGTSYPAGGIGPGNVCARVADNLINGGQWDHIYLVPIAEDGSAVAEWATGPFANRIAVAMARLRALGIGPQTDGVTFAIEWGQGETDNHLGTSQSAYMDALRKVISNAEAAGFSGRWFIAIETWFVGKTSPDIQAAQAAIVDNKTIFQSCNCDTIGAEGRNDRAGHFNDTGAAIAATLIANAMHASGPPFSAGR